MVSLWSAAAGRRFGSGAPEVVLAPGRKRQRIQSGVRPPPGAVSQVTRPAQVPASAGACARPSWSPGEIVSGKQVVRSSWRTLVVRQSHCPLATWPGDSGSGAGAASPWPGGDLGPGRGVTVSHCQHATLSVTPPVPLSAPAPCHRECPLLATWPPGHRAIPPATMKLPPAWSASKRQRCSFAGASGWWELLSCRRHRARLSVEPAKVILTKSGPGLGAA